METLRVDGVLLDAVTESARSNERRRMNHNLHHKMEDPIHRLLNAMEPDSYVQPHRHLAAPRTETLSCVRGRGVVIVFGDDGKMDERFVLSPTGPDFVAELPPGTWHSLLALDPGTVFFEVKAGPYVALEDDDIAEWAPAPGTPEVGDYLAQMRQFAIEGAPG